MDAGTHGTQETSEEQDFADDDVAMPMPRDGFAPNVTDDTLLPPPPPANARRLYYHQLDTAQSPQDIQVAHSAPPSSASYSSSMASPMTSTIPEAPPGVGPEFGTAPPPQRTPTRYHPQRFVSAPSPERPPVSGEHLGLDLSPSVTPESPPTQAVPGTLELELRFGSTVPKEPTQILPTHGIQQTPGAQYVDLDLVNSPENMTESFPISEAPRGMEPPPVGSSHSYLIPGGATNTPYQFPEALRHSGGFTAEPPFGNLYSQNPPNDTYGDTFTVPSDWPVPINEQSSQQDTWPYSSEMSFVPPSFNSENPSSPPRLSRPLHQSRPNRRGANVHFPVRSSSIGSTSETSISESATRIDSYPSSLTDPDIASIKDRAEQGIGADADVWKNYMAEALEQDENTLRNWNSDMDTMLIFAALFSAVLTAFIIEFYRLLQQNPQDRTVDLLTSLTQIIQAAGVYNNSLPISSSPSTFQPSTTVVWVNCLWFLSLTCSLGTAMAAMVVKQWLHFYSHGSNIGNPYDYTLQRQYRFNGLVQWGVPGIISALPVLMYISVGLFLMGLVLQLREINLVVANVFLGILVVLITAYSVTLFLPLLWSACPYKSSALVLLLQTFRFLYANLCSLHHNLMVLFSKAMKLAGAISTGRANYRFKPKSDYTHFRRNVEAISIKNVQPNLDIDSLIWLLKASKKPDVVDLALTSVSHLHHTPEMIDRLLEHGILDLLVQKAYVQLPALEHQFWMSVDTVTAHHPLVMQLSMATEFMQSLISVWRHPIYLSQHNTPAYSKQKQYNTSHDWLFGNWIRLWRLVKKQENCDFLELVNKSWDMNTFALLICTEVQYYLLQSNFTSTSLPPLYMHHLVSPDEDEPTTFFDLEEILRATVSQHLQLDEKTRCLLLETLAYVFATSSAIHIAHITTFRKDTLLLLLQLLQEHDMTYNAVLQRLVLCVEMFTLEDHASQIQLITGHQHSLGRQELYTHSAEVFTRVIGMFLMQAKASVNESSTDSDTILDLSIYQLFLSLLCMQKHKECSDQNKALISLPEKHADRFLQTVQSNMHLMQWKSTKSLLWFVELLKDWCQSGNLSTIGLDNAVIAFEKLLSTPWPDQVLLLLANQILPFLQQLLTSNVSKLKKIQNNVCISIAFALQTQIRDGHLDKRLLEHVLDKKVLNDVEIFLGSKECSVQCSDTWKEAIDQLKRQKLRITERKVVERLELARLKVYEPIRQGSTASQNANVLSLSVLSSAGWGIQNESLESIRLYD